MYTLEEGWVAIHLDKERHLKYDANALCSFEDVIGVPIGEAINSGRFTSIRGLLWAGLLKEDPQLKRMGTAGLEKVGDLMQQAPGEALEAKINYIKEKIGEAASLAYSGPKKEIGGTDGAAT